MLMQTHEYCTLWSPSDGELSDRGAFGWRIVAVKRNEAGECVVWMERKTGMRNTKVED